MTETAIKVLNTDLQYKITDLDSNAENTKSHENSIKRLKESKLKLMSEIKDLEKGIELLLSNQL